MSLSSDCACTARVERRALLGLALGLALFGAPACKGGYGVAIDVTLPAGVVDSDFTFTTSVFAPAAAAEVGSCADLEWGAHTLDELASALVGSQLLGGKLDIPRLGTKLVVVEAVGNESQQLALRGCAELGEIVDNTTVDVALTHVARLQLTTTDGPLSAAVPFGSAVELSSAPLVLATDHAGAPLSGAEIRVSFVGPDGEALSLSEDGDLLTDDDGEVALSGIAVDTMGPFSIAVTARQVLMPLPPPLSGYAVPAQTIVQPFPSTFLARVLVPARVGEHDAAFVGLGFDRNAGGLGAVRVGFAIPQATERGLPAFTVEMVAPPPAIGLPELVNQQPLAVIRDVTTPAREGVILFQRLARAPLNGMQPPCHLWYARPSGVGAPESRCVFTADETLGGVNIGNVALTNLVPVGRCDIDEGAGPWLTQARGEDETRTVLIDPLLEPAALRGLPYNTRPLGSFCVPNAGGQLERQLFVLSQPNTRWQVINLGVGLDDDAINTPGPLSAFAPVEIGLYGIVNAGIATVPEPEVMIAALGGTSFDVNRVQFVDDGSSVETVAEQLYALPGAPRFMLSGAFLVPGQRDDLHVLSVGTGADEGSLAPVVIASSGGQDDDAQLGVMSLRACPDGNCAVALTDFDDDGVNELFVAKTLLTAADRIDEDADGGTVDGGDRVTPIVAEVVRFTD